MSERTATSSQAPLVRDRHGAIIGVDYRRTGLSDLTVPGMVPADAVMPGDTVRLDGQELLVLTMRRHGVPGHVYIGTRTAGGAEGVFERRESERVRVVAVGGFDR